MSEELKLEQEISLWETIKCTTINIENELRDRYGKGIFFAPEIHIAFEFGKAIYDNRKAIFGTDENIEWSREEVINQNKENTIDVSIIKKGGPVDIIFKDKTNNAYLLIIELKIIGDESGYKKDIEFLKSQNEKINKYFCALIDKTAKNIIDINSIEVEESNKKIRITINNNEDFISNVVKEYSKHNYEFETNYFKNYIKKINCVLFLGKVK